MYYTIGVVGYSSTKFDILYAYDKLSDMLDMIVEKYADNKIIVVASGLTNIGVPALAYEYASTKYYLTVGIACSKAEEYECYPVHTKYIVGSEWGDESQLFLDSIDCIVRIGGGDQSREEVRAFYEKYPHKPIFEVEIPNVKEN